LKQLLIYFYLFLALSFVSDNQCSSKKRFCCLLQKLNNILALDTQIENTVNEINNNVLALADCDQNVVMISQADIPYIITEPGRYCLIEDVAVGAGQTAITIDFDAVVANITEIDLNGYTINGLVDGAPGAANGIVGIAAAPPVGQSLPVGVQIINGKIVAMLEHGIYIPYGISVLRVDNITVQSSGLTGNPTDGGIVIGSMDAPLLSPVISKTFVFGGSANDGLVLINPLNYLIENTSASLCGGDGISIEGQNFAVAGVITTCVSSGNGGSGFVTVVDDTNTAFINCVASSNGNGGYMVAGSQSTFTECRAKSNTGNGFTVTNIDNIFDSCFSGNNSGSGYAITAGSNNDIQQCVALGNDIDGFLINTAPNALNNNTSSGNGGFGFNATVLGNKIYANFANDNGTNYSGTITNVAVSPVPADPFNFTTNIEN
jgi:hypothetical protein